MNVYGTAARHTALTEIARVQHGGGVCAYVEPHYTDHADRITVDDLRSHGVRAEELLISQPDTGEQALEIVDTLARSGGVDLIAYGTTLLRPVTP